MPHFSRPLRFVESEDTYSVYVDDRGNEIFLQHETGIELVEFDSLDLDQVRADNRWITRDRFLDIVRDMVIDPDRVDDIVFCDDCDTPTDDDSDHMWLNDQIVCPNCQQNYACCERCEEYASETTTTLYDTEVCQSCLEWCYYYCDYCDGFYSEGDDEHGDYHNDGCDCEAPAQVFSVRNDGHGMLPNDTRATVSLPAGEISDEGIGEIARLLRDHSRDILNEASTLDPDVHAAAYAERRKWWDLSYRLTEIGTTWQAKTGNYTKRLSRFAYKEYGLKIPPAIVSEVGNIGRAHSNGVDFGIEVTRNLNLPAYEFAHEDSCWWQSYSESRCTLKSNGGYGLRTFNEHDGVTGRAWVLPLKLDDHGGLTPTFNTETPDAFVVFNGYGDLGGYTPARIVAHMAGLTYRKIEFTGSPMYVNGEAGYLVAPEEIAKNYTDGALNLYLDEHARLYDREQAAAQAARIDALVNA